MRIVHITCLSLLILSGCVAAKPYDAYSHDEVPSGEHADSQVQKQRDKSIQLGESLKQLVVLRSMLPDEISESILFASGFSIETQRRALAAITPFRDYPGDPLKYRLVGKEYQVIWDSKGKCLSGCDDLDRIIEQQYSDTTPSEARRRKELVGELLRLPLKKTAITDGDITSLIPEHIDYPDQWGYYWQDASYRKKGKGLTFASVGDKGEVFFYNVRQGEVQKHNDPSGIGGYVEFLNFFQGAEKILSVDQVHDITKKKRLKKIDWVAHLPSHHFSDGSSIVVDYGSGNCEIQNLDNNFSLIDKKGQVIKKVVVLIVYDEPIEVVPEKDCDAKLQPSKQQIFSLIDQFIFLGDDSFLLYGYDSPHTILRLDKDLNTKYAPKHSIQLADGKRIIGNVFVIPYDEIKTAMSPVKDREKALMQYLLEKRG